MTPIRQLLHKVDPYSGFDFFQWPENITGWNYEQPAFDHFIPKLKPTRILEVGTWLGASALRMAERCYLEGLKTEIVCVDTWLGSWDFWKHNDGAGVYESLKHLNGYPQVYYQFLANVCHKNFQDVITPFAQTSINAARLLAFHNLKFDMIYLDGSHCFRDVFIDLEHVWPLLRDGGTIIGDDWGFEEVKEAVIAFLKYIPYHVEPWHGAWTITKEKIT